MVQCLPSTRTKLRTKLSVTEPCPLASFRLGGSSAALQPDTMTLQGPCVVSSTLNWKPSEQAEYFTLNKHAYYMETRFTFVQRALGPVRGKLNKELVCLRSGSNGGSRGIMHGWKRETTTLEKQKGKKTITNYNFLSLCTCCKNKK